MHFQALNELTAYRGTIIVPDAEGARLLRAVFDQAAHARGEKTWRPADVLAWQSYLTRAFERVSLGGHASADLDFVLSADQELAVWESVVAAEAPATLAAPAQTAELARDAWRIVHQWDLPQAELFRAPVSEDVAAFRRWSEAYRQSTADLRVIEQARLPAHVVPHLHHETAALAHGFLEAAPALAGVFDSAGIQPRRLPERPHAELLFECRAFPDREAEIHTAATWAAGVAADDPAARVVVACEGLAADRPLVRRCVNDVLGGVGPLAHAFYLADETRLAQCPPVRDAVSILELAGTRPWDAVGEIIRSPHLRGGQVERWARAAADETLRGLGRHEMPAAFVHAFLAGAGPGCAELAGIWAEVMRLVADAPRRQRIVQWLEHFDRCLNAAGWPGDHTPDQTMSGIQRQWGEVCDRLHRLDAVLPVLSRGEALNRLRRLLNDTALRETPFAPRIFFVTPAEACMLEASYLWVAGCRSDAFVPAARPSGLLPFEAQRRAGVPGAESNRDLHRARALVDALAGSSGFRLASYSRGDGVVTYAATPLIPGLRAAAPEPSRRFVPAAWRRAREGARIARFGDDHGPALPRGARVEGGVSILASAAACPFQAFARYRLSATGVEEPRPGIDAREKGAVVHRALDELWRHIGDQAALADLALDDRRALVLAAIAKQFTPLRFETPLEREIYFVERDRLASLIDTWLEFELVRRPFTVVAAEAPGTVTFEGLEFHVRVDRIDRLDDGSQTIVDYKTGACRKSDWAVPRINEPQLPFYALTYPSDRTRAIAFAHVDSSKPAWFQVPGETDDDAAAFAELSSAWRTDLQALARVIRDGAARLDPKRGAQTCRYCDMYVLCRIADTGVRSAAEGEDDE